MALFEDPVTIGIAFACAALTVIISIFQVCMGSVVCAWGL
jgi:hypothetical protein